MNRSIVKQVVCFHLFNDYSGSPKVLAGVLKGLAENGVRVDLVTSGNGGALDGLQRLPGVRFHRYRYAFSSNPAVTMLRYLGVQLLTFGWALRWALRRDTVFYINTILPVGPALAGRLTGKRVVYHYHENAFAKGLVYRSLAKAMQRLAHEIVCVSAYQASFLSRKEHVTVVPNALDRGFTERLRPDGQAAFERKTILMLSSLKEYKGTRQFIELARDLSEYNFILVINDTQENIDNYLRMNLIELPRNLELSARQTEVAAFYNRASLVLNLSDKRLFVETFGLTALEAMSDGLPAIVPTVGGIAEMVDEGLTGFHIDVTDSEGLKATIRRVLTDRDLYLKLSEQALSDSKRYDADTMVDRIADLL